MRITSGIAATAGRFAGLLLAAGVAGCSTQETDFSKNEGAVAWLAHHRGAIPSRCISQLIERRGESIEINDQTRRMAQSDAMQMAGSIYAISLASENLIVAREKELELAREGVTRGYIVESGVTDAITNLNDAIFKRDLSRMGLASLDACNFTATDEAFGFKDRPQLSYYNGGR